MTQSKFLGTVTAPGSDPIHLYRMDDGSYVLRAGHKTKGEVIYQNDGATVGGYILGWLDEKMLG